MKRASLSIYCLLFFNITTFSQGELCNYDIKLEVYGSSALSLTPPSNQAKK